MSQDNRYSTERGKDLTWVVIDKTRQGPPVGGSRDENGARMIMSLLNRIHSAPGRGKGVREESG
jgi:hypothetical protein